MRALPVFVVFLLVSGCYLGHGTGESGGGPGLDASRAAPRPGRSDASTPPGGRDAGGPDAGRPAPAEPEPDLGPEGRPSGAPGADDWEEPPAIEGDSCCELSGPVLVTSRDLGMALDHAPPLIAWGPGRWRLAYARNFERGGEGRANRVVSIELDASGEVASDAQVVATPAIADPMTASFPQALRYRGGRWALVVSGEHGGDGREHLVRLYDHRMVPATEWLPLGVGMNADTAYLAHGNRWVAAVARNDVMTLTSLDERAGVAPSVEVDSEPSTTVHVEGFQSRAVVLASQLNGASGLGARVIVVDGLGTPRGHVPLAAPHQERAALGRLRDLAVVAEIVGGQPQVELVDPFEMRLVGRPQPIGDPIDPASGVYADQRSIDVVGSDKLGVAGVCWGVPGGDEGRDGSPSQIYFRLIGPDGRPRGTAVEVVSTTFRGNAVNCSLGSDGLGFLVGWWDGSELWVRRVDVLR